MEFGEDQEIVTERIPCQFCNRKFAPESLVKHSNVCEKTLNKKRKTFDSAKQRIQGTELAEFAPTNTIKKNETPTHSQLKEKHIPATRLIEATHHVPSRKNNKIASPVTKNSNYERCPHCDRSFGPKAFDRHIEWCKEQSIRINMQSNVNREAKERLEARTKYRPSFKSKRSITREKYSSKANDHDYRLELSVKNEESKENETKTKPREIETKIKVPDKLKPKENNREVNFIRQNVLRCSYKSRAPKKESKAEREKINDNYFKKSNISEIQDWISANGIKIKPSPQHNKMSPTNSQLTGSMYDEDYDPFIIAEHQMKELFDEEPLNETMNQTYTVNKRPHNSTQSKEDRRNKCQNKENISYSEYGPVKTKSCQTNDTEKSEKFFKTSPTSAFSKYSAQGNSDNIARAPTPAPTSELEKEDFNFLPPITNNTCKRVPSNEMIHDININRYPLISLSNLSLCSSVSVDIPEENRKLGMCKSAEVRNDVQIPLIKRSVSATNDKPNRNTLKKNLKMEHLLYGNEDSDETNSTVTPNTLVDKYDEKLNALNNLLDDENLDLINSFAEFENALQESCCDNDRFSFDSELQTEKPNTKLERGDSMASKMSIDSAYNSLNRKSPLPFDVHNFDGKTSTPETDALKSSTHSLTSDLHDGSTLNQPKLSKFCHECGAKFPLAIAKYCCECGVRRLVI